MPRLHLVLPGLHGVNPDWLAVEGAATRALAMLLARATRHAMPDDPLLRITRAAYTSAPVAGLAALHWLGEGGKAGQDYWLHADPVHLYPDQARLLMAGNRDLDVTQAEADALVATFNAHYADTEMRLHAPHPRRWYLQLPGDQADIQTTPLPLVIGRGIDGRLPSGPQGSAWRTVLNNVQMLFHDHAVNIARALEGKSAINSFWLWGGGRLPSLATERWSLICSDTPLGIGMARAVGVAAADNAALSAVLAAGPADTTLAVLAGLYEALVHGDEPAWRQALAALEQTWFVPALAAIRSGQLSELHLYVGDGICHVVTRGALRRIWRRPRTLADALP